MAGCIKITEVTYIIYKHTLFDDILNLDNCQLLPIFLSSKSSESVAEKKNLVVSGTSLTDNIFFCIFKAISITNSVYNLPNIYKSDYIVFSNTGFTYRHHDLILEELLDRGPGQQEQETE